MRAVLVMALISSSAVLSAQQPAAPWAFVSQGQARSGVTVQQGGPYDNAPWASIPARPFRPDSQVTAKAFMIRSWQEADKSRVVVYAVTEDRDSSGKNVDRQSQLASYLLNGGESVEAAATERYGAARINVVIRTLPSFSNR
jgi:hypothetical protein